MNSDILSSPCPPRTVVVTGAGGGLGRAITLRLLRDGFRCVLADRNEAAMSDTVSMSGGNAARATVVTCDLGVADDRRRLIDHAAAEPGQLYGLVHSAGIAVAEPLLDETIADWRTTLTINLEAAFFLTQEALEHMRRHREGRVVFIASVYGLVGMNNQGYGSRAPQTTTGDRGPVRQSAYAASKGGLVQLTRDLAAAVGPWGITINAVSPGCIPHGSIPADPGTESAASAREPTARVRPGLGDKIDPEILEALANQVPLRRLGRAEEVAGPVRFLLSDDATYITGANLIADGGWSIW